MKTNKKFKNYSLKAAKIAKKKKSVKGFTLVELIIVIAIIGILAVVLVPNMLNNVKKSRLATANDSAAKIAEQANIIAAELEMEGMTLAGTYTADVTLSGGSGLGAETETVSAFTDALNKAVPGLDANLDLQITFNDIGQVDFIVYHEDGSSYVGAYPDLVTMTEYENNSTFSAIVSDRAGTTTPTT